MLLQIIVRPSTIIKKMLITDITILKKQNRLFCKIYLVNVSFSLLVVTDQAKSQSQEIMSLSRPQQLEPVLPQIHQGTVLLYLTSSVLHFAVLKRTKGLNQALSIPRYIFSPFCLFVLLHFVCL